MYHTLRLAAIACFFAAIFSSCSKTPSLPATANYSFTSTFYQPVIFDLYNTQEDYNTNSNRIGQYTIPPHGTLMLPLQTLKTYYVDWYTPTYTYNNWQQVVLTNSGSPITPTPAIKISLEDDHFYLRANATDTTRSVLLNGSGASSTWKGTISNALGLNGTYILKFKRDFTCDYTFISTTGDTITRSMQYDLSSTYNNTSFTLTLLSDAGQAFASVQFGNYYSYSYNMNRDILLLGFVTNGSSPNTYYPIARQ